MVSKLDWLGIILWTAFFTWNYASSGATWPFVTAFAIISVLGLLVIHWTMAKWKASRTKKSKRRP